MQNAIDYYRKQFSFGYLSLEDRNKFIKEHGIENMSLADQDKYYTNSQFTKYFNSDPNFSNLKKLNFKQKNTLLDNAVLNETINKFFNKDNTSEENLTRINQLTPEGKKELLNSDYDPSDKYYNQNPFATIAMGATIGAGAGAWVGGVGAIPGAIAGAGYGALVSIGDALVSSLYNNNTESKLNDIVAKDNDRKKEQAQKITPQVSNLLGSITNGDIFKDDNAMQQAAPVLQELQSYGVNISKGEASNIDTLFNKVVAKNNSYYEVFKNRDELADLTNGDKMNMIVQTLATDLTFNDGGYSSMSINNQDLQNHISKNQSAWDWGFNTGKNVVVGTIGALGETVAGIAAAGAYGYDKLNNALGGDSHLTSDILEGKDVPLLLNLAYWDGVDKFNTFDSNIIKKARENGGISPYNNVSLAGEEGRFFSWESLNEGIKMGKYALANRVTGGVLGHASKLAKIGSSYGAYKLGMEATKALNLGNNVGKWSALGTYMASGVPVAAGYGLGAYEDTKLNLTEKEDTRQAQQLLQSYMNTEEFTTKVNQRAKELMQPTMVEGRNTNMMDEKTAATVARDQVGKEMAAYFTDYVKNNREEVAANNEEFKQNRDNIERIATDAFALDATIEAAKNTFININFKSYLFGKQTNQLLKGEQNGVKPVNPRITEQRFNYRTKKMELMTANDKGNLVFNPTTKQLEYNINPEKAGWKAVKDAVWGGFISNYTDDLTTGAVEGAAIQRYDNYLDQKYNKDAVSSVGKFLENLYSTSNAFIQGGEKKMVDRQSFYDGFIGALGAAVPGSGSLFKHSPYESSESRSKRSAKSKLAERLLSTTGLGNAYYNAKYQAITTSTHVSQINKILNSRSLDLNDILDLSSATNLAESAIKNGTLSDAKTAKDRAFLSILLFLNRNKDNPIVQAHPAAQKALKAIEAIREGTLGTKEASEEVKALYENLKQDFLKETYNKEEAKLAPEQAEEAADERLQHNIKKAKSIISSMDETMSILQIEHPNISQEALDYTTTLKVMHDLYNARILDMESTLGLTEGSTLSHKQNVNDILAIYNTAKKQEERLRAIKYQKESLSRQINKIKSQRKSKSKTLDKATIEVLKNQINKLSTEETLIKEASTYLDEEGVFQRAFTEQEIEDMDAASRAYLFNERFIDSQHNEAIDALEKKYTERGVSNVGEYMDDIAKLKDSSEGNISAFMDSFKNPNIAEELARNKSMIFLESLADTHAEITADALEEDLKSINSGLLEGTYYIDFQNVLPILYKYNNDALAKLKSRYENNEALGAAIDKVMDANSFLRKINLNLETFALRQSSRNIIYNALKNNHSIEAEFEEVFNSKEVDENSKAALKKAYNKAKGIENTEKSTVVETKEEKATRQESQKSQAQQEESKVQEAEQKAETKPQETLEVTEQEKSNEKNAQEAYEETSQEKSNEENAQEALEVDNKEAANDKYAEEHKNEINSIEDVDLGLESPTLEQQVTQEEAKEDSPIINTTEIKPDTTDQGNAVTHTSENMLGNTMYGFDAKALEEDAKEVERTGRSEGDKMSRFFNWFKNAGIKLQEIIDNELKDIIKANPKLETLYINPLENATDDAALSDFSLLCVEYTDAIKKIHNEDRGGVVTANGKQYLIVGTMGFDRRNSAQGNTYRQALNQGKKHRYKYFTTNPSERFYVDPTMHTEVEQMTSGRIVREMLGDERTEVRPVTELLSDAKRNPKGLQLRELKWGIQYDTKFATVGVSERNTVYPPRDANSNKGAVFLLIEAANGNYIPAAIAPTMLSDVKEGTLKSQLNNLFNELTSQKYADRKKAISQLVQLLNLNKEGDNILIGMEDKPTVSTVRNGVVLRTFNLADANFNRMEFINAINELNPRVNITLSTLSDPVQLKIFAEAGALNTDIAKLGTSNASYTVYAMDENGNPIKTKPIENGTPNLDANSDLEKADYKKKHSVYHKGVQYREKNGKWYDTNWKEITDPILLNQLKWASYIRANDLTPSLVSDDIHGNKNNKYYIINSEEANAKVIKVFENGSIAELSIADSRTTINIVHDKEVKAAREKAAKEEKERLEKIENSLDPNKVERIDEGEDVDLGEILTDEQLIAQGNGDFTSPATSQVTTEVEVKEETPKTPKSNEGSVNKSREDINKTGNKSLAELQESANAKPADANSILKNRTYGRKVREVLKAKGFKGKPSEVEAWLKEHNMPTTNITDVDAWIDMLQNCR